MDAATLKEFAVTAAASISAVGIPTLIALIWRWHSTQLDTIKLFTFKQVEEQVTALAKTNEQLRKYAADLERRALAVPLAEVEEAVKLVAEARELLHREVRFFVEQPERGRFSRLRAVLAERNVQAMETAQNILEKLLQHETKLRDMLARDAIARMIQEKPDKSV